MSDIANLRPTSDAAGGTFSLGQGAWTRAGGRVAGACYSGCDEGSLDEADSGYALARTSDTSYNSGRFEFYLGAPPTGVAISSLSIKAYCRISSAGPNFFVESPRMKGFVNVGGTRYYQSGPSYVTVSNHTNRNTTPVDAGTGVLFTVGTWATNPVTSAAWTLSDLAAGVFIAGLEAGGVAEGQAGNGIPHANGGSTAQFDLLQFWVELTTTPSETFVTPIRLGASAVLRWLGRPLRVVEFKAPVEYSELAPGSTVYVTHPWYPTEDGLGAGVLSWQRRPLKVLQVSDMVDPPEVRVRAIDLRDRACTFWSPWRTDLGADTVNWSGIARFDQGGGYTFARTSADWIERPTDRLYVSISANQPRITPWGLLIQGGSYSGYSSDNGENDSVVLDNTFARGTGGHDTTVTTGSTTAFTSWTASVAGGGALKVWKDSRYRFDDATTYARHAKLSFGAAYGTDYAYLSQALSSFPNVNFRARVLFSLEGSADPLQTSMILRRTLGGTANDWTTSGWSASLAWRKFVNGQTSTGGAGKTSFFKSGNHYEYWSDEIPFGTGATPILTPFAALHQENNSTLYLHQVLVVHTGTATAQAKRVIRREVDVTQGSVVTGAADVLDLNNDASYRIVEADHGTLAVVFTPRWGHEDLDDGADKYLLTIVHDSTNNDREELFYHRTNSTTGVLYFRRVYGGASIAEAQYALSGSNLASYLTSMKVAARWTGSAGELGLTVRSLDVFLNGVKGGTTATAANVCRMKDVGDYVAVGRKATSTPGSVPNMYQFADGYLADMEFRADVLSDMEVAALHNGIGKNLNLPTTVV
jgi:hypothetical protein